MAANVCILWAVASLRRVINLDGDEFQREAFMEV